MPCDTRIYMIYQDLSSLQAQAQMPMLWFVQIESMQHLHIYIYIYLAISCAMDHNGMEGWNLVELQALIKRRHASKYAKVKIWEPAQKSAESHPWQCLQVLAVLAPENGTRGAWGSKMQQGHCMKDYESLQVCSRVAGMAYMCLEKSWSPLAHQSTFAMCWLLTI